MKAEYKDNAEKGPGYGIINLCELMPPDGPWKIAIQRGSDHNYISGAEKDHWTGEIIFIPVEGMADSQASLKIYIGPLIVDALDPKERYRITLKGQDDIPATAALRLDAVAKSRQASLDNMARPEDIKPEQTQEQTEETAENRQEPQELQNIELKAAENTQNRPKNSKLWRLAVILLLMAACLAWYFVQKKAPAAENAEPKQQETNLQKTAPQKNAENAPKPQKQEQPKPPRQETPQEKVRKFFADSGKTAEKAMTLYMELPKNSDADKDDAYRLLYFASQADNANALYEYGKCLDPALPKWGTIEKDGALAYKAYAKAAEQNCSGANEARENLKTWLMEQKKNGNANAAKWLVEIH